MARTRIVGKALLALNKSMTSNMPHRTSARAGSLTWLLLAALMLMDAGRGWPVLLEGLWLIVAITFTARAWSPLHDRGTAYTSCQNHRDKGCSGTLAGKAVARAYLSSNRRRS